MQKKSKKKLIKIFDFNKINKCLLSVTTKKSHCCKFKQCKFYFWRENKSFSAKFVARQTRAFHFKQLLFTNIVMLMNNTKYIHKNKAQYNCLQIVYVCTAHTQALSVERVHIVYYFST